MKEWITNIKRVLRSKRGETLMEAIVSVFVLILLVTAVGTTIQYATKLTGLSIRQAEGAQANINHLVAPAYESADAASEWSIEITLSYDVPGGIESGAAKHDAVLREVTFDDGSRVFAFVPDPSETTPSDPEEPGDES